MSIQWIEAPLAIVGFILVAGLASIFIHDAIYGKGSNPYDGF